MPTSGGIGPRRGGGRAGDGDLR